MDYKPLNVIKMGGITIYWTLPPKKTPFQTGIDR
jgi:hypothetical protein